MFPDKIEKYLLRVQKPGRYTGGELNSVIKDKSSVDVRFAFCFPDTYEIGMSHLGMKILYSLINSREDSWCERVFAPWTDMEEYMRSADIPLYALESGDAVKDFDIIGFTMMYELCYTNILNMLDLAGVPLRSKDRTSLTPLVVGGGACVCNIEPMAEFFDLTMLGDGEEVMNDLIDLFKIHKAKGSTKQEFLAEAAGIPGVYVPSLYDIEYNENNTVKSISPKGDAPAKVVKRVVKNLDTMYAPDSFVVPFIEVVHDRTTVETFRGCIRGCRFCQAGFLYRPIREKSPEVVEKQCREIYEKTGYDEISLCSLSTSDYTGLEKLLNSMLEWTIPEKVNVALPSLRADNFPEELMKKINSVRRSGLTFAPEAGTQRLRDVINKNVTEEEVLATVSRAFSGGWTAVKLYFMIGLPTETEEDLKGIADLSQTVVDAYYNNPDRPKGRGVNVSVSLATLVPKPFTPFQWEPMITPDEIVERQQILLGYVRSKKVSIGRHKSDTSFLEGVFARGDRRLADVIEAAWRNGCKFDGWDDCLDIEKWLSTFRECGVDPFFYTARTREYDEIFPWDHMDCGVSKSFLMKENQKAHRAETTPCCREKCAGCGAAAINGGECSELCKNMV